uniref:t-SNARE coiled-coil homology domain-containing protein n=1 Tax=Proboscia inermis TaxID=420281 RepID=A0A7S0GGM3_9STRA|mmetsp:Transcript_46942/g.47400  ORF Transcript_46942/g.47400 Transcript_46942/m.47400 type:complete len:112 (+) Transcript_46942:24-359(+)
MHSRRGRDDSKQQSAVETNQNIVEQQNNDRISELSSQVGRLKGLTMDIENEVREQNVLLEDMGDGFSSARDLISGSLQRIGLVFEQGGVKNMLRMVGTLVIAFVFLYWVMG